MHHEDIKAEIRKLGVTPSALARELGVGPNTVSAVIKGRTRSQRIEQAISRITKIPLDRLWPDIYGRKEQKTTVKQLLRRAA
jgi:lambda repressor-like predicted transcriptional regulator